MKSRFTKQAKDAFYQSVTVKEDFPKSFAAFDADKSISRAKNAYFIIRNYTKTMFYPTFYLSTKMPRNAMSI
jgi:hypothetical protein